MYTYLNKDAKVCEATACKEKQEEKEHQETQSNTKDGETKVDAENKTSYIWA